MVALKVTCASGSARNASEPCVAGESGAASASGATCIGTSSSYQDIAQTQFLSHHVYVDAYCQMVEKIPR